MTTMRVFCGELVGEDAKGGRWELGRVGGVRALVGRGVWEEG